jgi:hypothetical protein
LYGGILVALGIFRKQFPDNGFPVGTSSDNIGKRTAAIDPKLPQFFTVLHPSILAFKKILKSREIPPHWKCQQAVVG